MKNNSYLSRYFGHLITITKHKILVTSLCFKCGLYWQGLMHDLSKYSPIEFFAGVKYYQGFRSPISAEREDKGYSLGWLHHAGRNRHHWEYWIDKNYKNISLVVLPIPLNYLIEGACDRITASKVYNKNYNQASAYDFFKNGKDIKFMGKDNVDRYELLLSYLKDNGEKEAIKYYKSLYKKWKKDKSFNI